MTIRRTVLCLISTASISVSIGLNLNQSVGASVTPKTVTGHLLVRTNSRLPFGALITHSMLKSGSITSKVLFDSYGYALATIGNYEYPVSTTNIGQRWRIAGNYFNIVTASGMSAGGTPTSISVFSQEIAIAFRAGDILSGMNSSIYVTDDAGRRWYVASLPGTVHGVESTQTTQNHLKVWAIVYPSSTSGEKSTYSSLDGGRHWSRL
jgi:hypothetical protein